MSRHNRHIHAWTWGVLLAQAATIWFIVTLFTEAYGPKLTGAALWTCFGMVFVLAWSMGQIVYSYVRWILAMRKLRRQWTLASVTPVAQPDREECD